MFTLFYDTSEKDYMLYEHSNFEKGIAMYKKPNTAQAWYEQPISGAMRAEPDGKPDDLDFMSYDDIKIVSNFDTLLEYKTWIITNKEVFEL